MKNVSYYFVYDIYRKLLKKLETADDCIVNLPQVEEILSSLITNKILLLNPEAVACIIQCLFEYSKIFKNSNKNNDFITNFNLSKLVYIYIFYFILFFFY